MATKTFSQAPKSKPLTDNEITGMVVADLLEGGERLPEDGSLFPNPPL